MQHGLDAVETEIKAPPLADAAGPLERILERINQAIVIVSSVALGAPACVLTYSVASRYFLHFSTDWQDVLLVFLIIRALLMRAHAIQAPRCHARLEPILGSYSPTAPHRPHR